MNRREIISKTAEILREADARKHFAAARSKIHISDDFGNKRDFIIKKDDTDVLYNSKDVATILDAIVAAIMDGVRHGQKISINPLGSLVLEHKNERRVIHPETKDWVIIPERWVPKYYPSNAMKRCATAYGISLTDDVEYYDPDEVEVDDDEEYDDDIQDEEQDGDDLFAEDGEE